MADFRRYQPHYATSSTSHLGRWLVLAVAVVAVIFLSQAMFGGKKSSTNDEANANVGISLLTDNTNTTVANANAAANSSSNISTTMAAIGGSWKGFSVKRCPSAISTFGTNKRVVFTIGLSYVNDAAEQVLTALHNAGVPADFLSSGSFASKNAAFVKSVAQAGYAVYSQSYDNTDLAKASDTDVLSAISKAETAIAAATGISPKPVFRPPFGSYTAQTVSLLNQQGYCAVLWTVDSYDWSADTTPADAQEKVMTALDKQTGGAIVALHAGYDMTPQLITDLITAIKAKGFEIVTLATLLNSSSS